MTKINKIETKTKRRKIGTKTKTRTRTKTKRRKLQTKTKRRKTKRGAGYADENGQSRWLPRMFTSPHTYQKLEDFREFAGRPEIEMLDIDPYYVSNKINTIDLNTYGLNQFQVGIIPKLLEMKRIMKREGVTSMSPRIVEMRNAYKAELEEAKQLFNGAMLTRNYPEVPNNDPAIENLKLRFSKL